MSATLLLSLPVTGKTQTCIKQIKAHLREHPLARVWVIVPDRLQAAQFRQRLSVSGGAVGAHVGTFGDLYKAILEQAGSFIPVASDALLHRLVQDIVDEADLVHYAPLRALPGFILALRDSFAELKRALIYPENFIEQSKSASLPQQELASLYFAYQTKLQELNWADAEGLSWLAVEALETKPTLLNNAIQLMVVDGFDSFIGTQRHALQLLANKTDLQITLEGNQDSARSAHRRFKKTLDDLLADLPLEVVPSSSNPNLPQDMAQIEQYVFEPANTIPQKSQWPFLLEVRSPADEAREALRWIKARVIRDEIPLQACAIFTPNPDIHRPLLRSAAREFGIPVRFTQSDPITASPAIAALVNLLNLPVQNFRSSALFKTLRSPYFSHSFGHESIDTLEKISRIAQIIEGQTQWEETWERLAPSKPKTQLDLDDERILADLPRGDFANALRSQLDAFLALLTPSQGKQSQTEWTGWLEDLLDTLQFHQNLAGERDELAVEGFRDALRALVLSEAIAGKRKVDFAGYVADLQGVLEGSALREPHNGEHASLLIGSLREARGLRFQAVVLLGFSEGIFPEVERPDPFLPEELRAALGLDSRLDRDQASLFYQAVTRSDSQLLITRPYLSEDGENWEASPFWNAVMGLFDEDAVQKIRPDDPRPLTEAASSQEVLFWAVRRKSLPGTYVDLTERWKQLQTAREVIQARQSKQPGGTFEGSVPDLADELSKRYSSKHIWSASRLEAYGACPQMFYIGVALDLERVEPASLGLDVRQIGSILHKILEETYGATANPADVDSVLKKLPAVARHIFETAPQAYGFRPSELWELEQEQFLTQLENTIRALDEVSAGWTPFAYEAMFGIQHAPPLEIPVGQEQLLVRGVIDRVDRNTAGELRVVDYKTGSSHLAQDDLKNGRRLQLPLYALAARDALQLGDPVDGMYWKILAAEAGSLKLAKFKTASNTGVEAAFEVLLDHLLHILTGIRSGEFPPIPPKGGCPEYCPAAQWCWRCQKAGW